MGLNDRHSPTEGGEEMKFYEGWMDLDLHIAAIKGLFGIAVNIICAVVGLSLMFIYGSRALSALAFVAPYLP